MDQVRPGDRGQKLKISLVIPTLNEAENIEPLLARLNSGTGGLVAEVIFVDDSTDHTPDVIGALIPTSVIPVQMIHREPHERSGGLGGAVVAGIKASGFDWVCVMDGDLQHPPELIPTMVERALTERADLVAASRFNDGGSANLGRGRNLVSRAANGAARAIFPHRLGNSSDPMTGFFLFRKDAIDVEGLNPSGFKILLEILVNSPELSVSEVGFEFGQRHAELSKASVVEAGRYLRSLVRLRGRAKRGPSLHLYDVHGIVRVDSDVRLPELELFRVREMADSVDIRVRVGKVGHNRTEGPGSVLYREPLGRLGFSMRITRGSVATRGVLTDVTVSAMVGKSPHVLYTNVVEPILRWAFVERGFALVHCACVESDGDVFAITARTDTGKTTTMLKLLEGGQYGFVSDDLVIVSPNGTVLTYPKPLTISQHTLQAVNANRLGFWERIKLPFQSRLHSRSGRKVGHTLAKSTLPVATMNALVQRMVPPPKYQVDRLIPGVEMVQRGELAGLFIIERAAEGEMLLDHEVAMEILLENCEDAYGFPPYNQIEAFLQRNHTTDLRAEERATIAEAFADVPTTLIRSNTYGWARRVEAYLDDHRKARVVHVTPPVEPDLTIDLRMEPAESNGDHGEATPALEDGAPEGYVAETSA